jgi:HAD superfamily hydrolase (TIGR01509 family)
MDGTLIDSEPVAAAVVAELLAQFEIDHTIGTDQIQGVTWANISAMLRPLHREFANMNLRRLLSDRCDDRMSLTPPPPIAGAVAAVRAASKHLPTAVVSSSDRATIESVVQRLNLKTQLKLMVGAEDVQRSKPNPECFLLAARRLGVPPASCLVFEDSDAGLKAAHAAGMRTIAIGKRKTPRPHALHTIADYRDLEDGFFADLGCV